MRKNSVLWVIQGLLALVFLFAGCTKLVLPIEAMTRQMHFPGPFLRFLGVAEIAGALGLILPIALHIREGLTPLAAIGLLIIMIGAIVVTAMTGPLVAALAPAIVGAFASIVVYGRWRSAPVVR
jgi:uncharacterized membrane protein YphA (DoxX/SURF4 family)